MRNCPIQKISQQANESGTPFLVIGGYAVQAHGYVRTTDDLDLIVPRGRRRTWSEMLVNFGMAVKNDAANFSQFEPTGETGMGVDLMFVSEEVFTRLDNAAFPATIDGVLVRVVSLVHLIALKCHSFQNSKTLRRLKDMDDLIQLVLVNGLDLNEPELRATISSMVIWNCMKNCNTPVPSEVALHDAVGLEFPDWSGMLPHCSRMTFEEAVRWNDDMLSLFPHKNTCEVEAERRCHAEFVL